MSSGDVKGLTERTSPQLGLENGGRGYGLILGFYFGQLDDGAGIYKESR